MGYVLVTDMSELFQNQTDCNAPIGNWDVSSVTRMDRMFFGAASFNQPIGDWNVARVQNMDGMFRSASCFENGLTEIPGSMMRSIFALMSRTASSSLALRAWSRVQRASSFRSES